MSGIVLPLGRTRVIQAAAVVAILAIIAVVVLRPGARYQVIDGFPIGPPASCGACTDEIAMATTALDVRDPGHARVQSATPYADVDPCRNGMSAVPCVRDSSVVVVVFSLADGSKHATGVACIGIDPCVGTGSYPFALP